MADFLEQLTQILRSQVVFGPIKLPFTYLSLIWGFAVPLVLSFVLYKIILFIFRKVFSRTKLKDETKEKVDKWARRGLRILYLVTVFSFVARLFGAELFRYLEWVYTFLNEPFFVSGSTQISVVTLILTIPIFIFSSWIGKLSYSLLDKSLLSRLSLDPSKRFSIASLLRYGTMTLIFLIGLSIVGIDLSSLVVLFGVLGIGVGFGLQTMVANFFAGIIIILTRPIKEGDRILVNEIEGTVIQIRIMTTIVNTLTHETIILPNSNIVENSVHNYSFQDRRIIISNDVSISYESDLELTKKVLLSVGGENPFVDKGKEPVVFITGFAESGINVSLWTYIKDAEVKKAALSWGYETIWKRFKANGISIPYPHMDVRYRRLSSEHA